MDELDEIFKRRLKQLFQIAELPSKFFEPQKLKERKIDKEAWDFLENYRRNTVEFVTGGMGLVVISPNVGNGKTSWVVRLLQRYIAETALDGRLADRGLFINCAKLLQELGDYNYFSSAELKERLERLKNVDLLVIDELGSGNLNKIAYPYFYDLINYRVDNQKATFYTSNLNDNQITQWGGERLYSRIFDTNPVVTFNADNVRGLDYEEIK